MRMQAPLTVFAIVTAPSCSLLLDTSAATGGDPPDAGTSADAGDAGGPKADPYGDEVRKDTPIAWYRFEDDALVTCKNEVAGNAATCAYPTTGIRKGEGISGNAVCFDLLTSAVSFVHLFTFEEDDPFTIEAWIKLDSTPGEWDVFRYEAARNPMRTGTWVLTSSNADIFAEAWETGTHIMYSRKRASLVTNRYMHVVLLHTNRDELYLDASPGEAAVINTSKKRSSASSVPFEVGGFDGCVDELAVYDHALDPARILAHFVARPQ